LTETDGAPGSSLSPVQVDECLFGTFAAEPQSRVGAA